MKRVIERFGAPSFFASGAKAIAILVISIAAVSLLSTAASGTVVGTLATGSSGTVTASLTSVLFTPDPAALGGTNFSCPSASCDSDVATSTSLTFAGCASGTLGAAGCLSSQEGIDVNSPITVSSIGENNFLTFSNNASLVFSLLNISTYSNASCASLTVGNSCVVYPGSALLLTLLPNNETLVSLNVSGKASDTGVGGLSTGSNYNGGFSQTLTQNLPNSTAPTPGDIQAYFCGTNSVTSISQCLTYEGASTLTITSSQSGSFTATSTPEPGTFAFLLIGGVLIGVNRIRRRV